MTADVTATVIVSTRNPDERIVETVRSILASQHPAFALCLVDQSDDDGVASKLGDLLRDPRVHYVPCSRKGLSIGRNLGAEWAPCECLAFTDDDCVVTPEWLTQITEPFARDTRIAVVFGTVKPAPHDPALGFLPSYGRHEPFLARSIYDKHRVEGMGASMAIRRSVWESLNGFDELLGAGAPLRSAEETDFVIRALLAGFYAYETTGGVVVHSGFRTWADGPRVFRDYLYGIGAALAKNLKRGHWRIFAVAGRLAVRWLVAHPVVNLGAQSHRRARLVGFCSGVRRALAMPVDHERGHFRADETGEAEAWQRGTAGDGSRPSSTAAARVILAPVITDRSPAELDPPVDAVDCDRVSIVMPSWNARPFLERALTSLVAHTTYPYELIVVDNGSTDGSKEYIREFFRDHPELDATLIDNSENLYFSTACNQGFRAASPRSKYLALYCNDVEARHPHWLQELVAAVQPEDTIAAGHVGIEPITDRQRGVFLTYDPIYPNPQIKPRIVDLMNQSGATYSHVYGYCFLLKRSLLHRTGLYLHTGPFTQYHSDWEWYLRFAALGYRVAGVPIKVHHWHSISELLAFHPDLYNDLLRRIEDPATLERYLSNGRPFYESESGFRSKFPTWRARTMERLKRSLFPVGGANLRVRDVSTPAAADPRPEEK